jgi:hypothetical protein
MTWLIWGYLMILDIIHMVWREKTLKMRISDVQKKQKKHLWLSQKLGIQPSVAQKRMFCVVGTGPLRRLSIKNHPIWRGQNGQWLICRYYCAGFRSSQSFGANESTHAFRSFRSYCTCCIILYNYIMCIYIYIIYMCVCIHWAYNIPVGKSTPWWVSGGTIVHISDVHVHSSSSSVDLSSSFFFFIIIIIFYCFSCLLSTFIVSVWYGICVRAIYSWL